jgi:hypothetical protein
MAASVVERDAQRLVDRTQLLVDPLVTLRRIQRETRFRALP